MAYRSSHCRPPGRAPLGAAGCGASAVGLRAAALLAFLALPGCWLGQNSSATAEYSRQVSIASLRVAQLEEALTDAEARVAQLEEYVRLQGDNEVDRIENFDQVVAELSSMRGELERLRFDLEGLSAQQERAWIGQEKRQLHDEMRLQKLEAFTGVTPPPPPTDEDLGLAPGTTSSAANPPVGGTSEPSTDPAQELPDDLGGKLDLAVKLMMKGDNAPAREILEGAIQVHPGEPLLDETRYRLAETFFNEKRWGTAARAFHMVVTNHAQSPWAAWSMLRQGECFEQMGQPDNAQIFFEDLVATFPKSDAAKEAKTRLSP
jgi:TolA-binding protein